MVALAPTRPGLHRGGERLHQPFVGRDVQHEVDGDGSQRQSGPREQGYAMMTPLLLV